MTPEIWCFVGAVAYLALVAFFFACRRQSNHPDARAVLLRLRLELRSIRRELDLLPATREVYRLRQQMEETFQLMDEIELHEQAKAKVKAAGVS